MADHSGNLPVLLNFWGKRATSYVWNYFGFEADANGKYKNPKKAICRTCYHGIKYVGNTTNMANHLSTHKDISIPCYNNTKMEVVETCNQNDSNDSFEPPEKVAKNELMVVEFWSKSKRSIVWEYFGFYATADGEYVDKTETVCKLCQTCLRYNGNTTNLANHLMRYHGIEGILTYHDPNLCVASDETTARVNQILKAAVAMQKPGDSYTASDTSNSSQEAVGGNPGGNKLPTNTEITSGFRMNFPSNNDLVTTTTNEVGPITRRKNTHPAVVGTIEGITSDRLSMITTAIGNYLIDEKLTWSHVNSPGFIRFVQALVSSYKMPSPEYFQGSLFQRQINLLQMQLEGMKTAKRHVLTQHGWTLKDHSSKNNAKHYKTLVVNYIDEEFQLKSHVLETVEGNLDNTIVASVRDKWGLKEVVILGSVHGHLDQGAAHLPCFAATIKTALLRVFQNDQMRDMLLECSKRCLEIEDNMLDKNLTDTIFQLSLGHGVQDDPWKVHDMLIYYKSVSAESGQLDIQDILDILKSLKTALDMLMAKGSTAALILPTLFKLTKKQFLPVGSEPDVIKEVKSTLVATLDDTYFKDPVYNFLAVSTAIDPRLKSLDWMEDAEKENCYALVAKEALDIVTYSEELLKIKQEPDEEASTDQESVTGYSDNPANDLSFLADVLSKARNTTKLTPEEEVKAEIGHYRREKKSTGGTVGLAWWASRTEAYPILSMLARKYLCIPATSLDSSTVIHYPVSTGDTLPSNDEINQLVFVYNNSSTEERNRRK